MRRLVPAVCLLVVAGGCRSSCGGGAAAAADAGSSAPEAATSAPAVIPSASGSAGHFLGVGRCDPRKDGAVCSPDGKSQLSCGLGDWITVQLCDGPAGCKGRGDDLVCDVKPVKAGDPCANGMSPPRCNGTRELLQCKSGKWASLVCSGGGTCRPPTSDMPSSCR